MKQRLSGIPTAIALAIAVFVCAPLAARTTLPQVGRPAPAIEATTLDGAHFSLAAERGHVVVVHFWATWCAPCRKEMPLLQALYARHRADGLRVVAISLDDPADLAQVRQAMGQFEFPAALLGQAQARGYGRPWHIPLTFVIDRQGVLRRDAWKASPSVDAATLDAAVLPLL